MRFSEIMMGLLVSTKIIWGGFTELKKGSERLSIRGILGIICGVCNILLIVLSYFLKQQFFATLFYILLVFECIGMVTEMICRKRF